MSANSPRSTWTGSTNTTLATNIYDTYNKYAMVAAPGIYESDTFSLNANVPRGNVTQAVRPGTTTNYQFDITGMVVQADDNNGHAVSVTAASGMNNNVAGTIQPNTGEMLLETINRTSRLIQRMERQGLSMRIRGIIRRDLAGS